MKDDEERRKQVEAHDARIEQNAHAMFYWLSMIVDGPYFGQNDKRYCKIKKVLDDIYENKNERTTNFI
jgi:hypothetical protein